jgi:RNA polymerase sigma factor (sigma-70 family)
MSPLTLRRYRAERLLRQEFERLRAQVTGRVRARLGASGASLAGTDLDACYAQAWQGLYAAVLEGQQISNPTGWLALVTYRRAIEELRDRRHVHHDRPTGDHASGQADLDASAAEGAQDPDLAAELDDRMRLRQLFEGLRGRLSAREREAAAFCYLQGLSRSEAAARMKISESRMRKLMDGRGPGRPGVAGKVGELAETIRSGGWCEEQGSLMRGLAYGILDPDGERHRLAVIHRSECPACRAYVVSLRGLATVLPPVLSPWGLGAGALARAGAASHAGAGVGAQAGAGVAGGASPPAGAALTGALSASGAASVGGAAGGGWLLAGGPLGAKLAVGCLLALGVGAGCVSLSDGSGPDSHHERHDARALQKGTGPGVHAENRALAAEEPPAEGLQGERRADGTALGGASQASGLAPAQRAAREFGPERPPGSGEPQSASSDGAWAPTATSASSESTPSTAQGSSTERRDAEGTSTTAVGRHSYSSPGAAEGGAASPAEREFGIG